MDVDVDVSGGGFGVEKDEGEGEGEARLEGAVRTKARYCNTTCMVIRSREKPDLGTSWFVDCIPNLVISCDADDLVTQPRSVHGYKYSELLEVSSYSRIMVHQESVRPLLPDYRFRYLCFRLKDLKYATQEWNVQCTKLGGVEYMSAVKSYIYYSSH